MRKVIRKVIWFAFAPISHQAASYFNRPVSTINLLSQAFMVIRVSKTISDLQGY